MSKRPYDAFGLVTIIGMALILLAGAVALLLKPWAPGDKLLMLGVWVIVSFLIMVGVEGNARGIPRNAVKVPWRWALLTFALATVLFALAGYRGISG